MMARRRFIASSTAGIVLATHSSPRAGAQERTTTGPKTGFAPVKGLSLYYEIHGSGEPLILLHGGAVGIVMFGQNVAQLAKNRKVIALELQGHGRTADIDRPLSFEAMADDVAGLMKYLGIEKADVMGYSLGGGVALRLPSGIPNPCESSWSSQRPSSAMDGTPRFLPQWHRWVRPLGR